MPQLHERAIDEFQNLWREHYGEDLPREEAVGRAHQVFTHIAMLVGGKAHPKEESKGNRLLLDLQDRLRRDDPIAVQ